MKVTSEKEISLYDFDAWSGGRDTLDDLTSAQCETIEQYLEDLYPDGIDETDLNDFLWFERDTIAEWLGYSSYEALMNGEEEDEEEEDEEYIEGLGIAGFEVTELTPQYDSRQSFYGKALVVEYPGDPNRLHLLSYRTDVAIWNKRSKTLEVKGWYTATTNRHIREFARQLGIELPAGSKIAGKYKA